MFSKCIRFIAYTCKDGPWKHTYVKYGYDPRNHRDALVYQVVTITLN